MLAVSAHMPFTDVCSTVSCWALILSVIFPPAHVLALDLISTPPTHPHPHRHISHHHGHHHHHIHHSQQQNGHHGYRISSSSAYSLTVYLDSTLQPFSASVSPLLFSPTPFPSLPIAGSSSFSEKCSLLSLSSVRRHSRRLGPGSVKRSRQQHYHSTVLPPSQKQENVHPAHPSTTTTTPASAQQIMQRPATDRQRISERNIKKQIIYINNDTEQSLPVLPVRVSRGQIRRLIRHQSSSLATDPQQEHQKEPQWSQILDVFWNRETFQDTTLHKEDTENGQTLHHRRQQGQRQQEQEQEQGRHDHAYESQLSEDNNNSNHSNDNDTEEESGLWQDYVYPTGWNRSSMDNDLFPLTGSILKFPLSWPLRPSSSLSSSPLDFPWLALVECTLQSKAHLRSATQLGAKAVILYPSPVHRHQQADAVHCSSLLLADDDDVFGDTDADVESVGVVVPTLTLDALTAKNLLEVLQRMDSGSYAAATLTIVDSIQEKKAEEDEDGSEGEDRSNSSSSMTRGSGKKMMRDSSDSVVVTSTSSQTHSSLHPDLNSTTTFAGTTTTNDAQQAKELLKASLTDALKSGALMAKRVLIRLGLDNRSGKSVGLVTPHTAAASVAPLSSSSSSAGWIEKEDIGMLSTRFSPLSASGVKPDLILTTG
ncbi:hypothetical protein BGX29_000118, partial [Mortierella sp. GBA35]